MYNSHPFLLSAFQSFTVIIFFIYPTEIGLLVCCYLAASTTDCLSVAGIQVQHQTICHQLLQITLDADYHCRKKKKKLSRMRLKYH